MGPSEKEPSKDDSISDLPLSFYNSHIDSVSINHVNKVRFLSADFFQQKLIKHFDMLFTQHEIL